MDLKHLVLTALAAIAVEFMANARKSHRRALA